MVRLFVVPAIFGMPERKAQADAFREDRQFFSRAGNRVGGIEFIRIDFVRFEIPETDSNCVQDRAGHLFVSALHQPSPQKMSATHEEPTFAAKNYLINLQAILAADSEYEPFAWNVNKFFWCSVQNYIFGLAAGR